MFKTAINVPQPVTDVKWILTFGLVGDLHLVLLLFFSFGSDEGDGGTEGGQQCGE